MVVRRDRSSIPFHGLFQQPASGDGSGCWLDARAPCGGNDRHPREPPPPGCLLEHPATPSAPICPPRGRTSAATSLTTAATAGGQQGRSARPRLVPRATGRGRRAGPELYRRDRGRRAEPLAPGARQAGQGLPGRARGPVPRVTASRSQATASPPARQIPVRDRERMGTLPITQAIADCSSPRPRATRGPHGSLPRGPRTPPAPSRSRRGHRTTPAPTGAEPMPRRG